MKLEVDGCNLRSLSNWLVQCCIIRVAGQGMYIFSVGTADSAMCSVPLYKGTVSSPVLCHCVWIGCDCNCTPGVSVDNGLGVCMIVQMYRHTDK